MASPDSDKKQSSRDYEFSSVINRGTTLSLTKADLPWLAPGEQVDVHLVDVTLSKGGETIRLGSAVRGRALTSEADRVTNGEGESAFYAGVTRVVRDKGYFTKLDKPRTPHTLYKVGSAEAQDTVVVFAGLANTNVPTYVRVASSAPSRERKVLAALTR